MTLRSHAVLALALLGLACGPGSPELVRRPERPPDAVLVQHTAVLDVEAGRVEQDRDVLIAEGRIAAMSDLRAVILDGVPLLRIPVTAAGEDGPGARL